MRFPDASADPLEGILRFPTHEDAVAKAAHLEADTALGWDVEYHPDTARFHVALDAPSSRMVTASTGRPGNRASRCRARRSLG
jgi:hypothetical protein